MQRILILICGIFICFSQTSAGVVDEFGSNIQKWMQAASVPGVVVATYGPEGERYWAYGTDTDAVFEAASNGKVIAAYALLRLAQQNRLSLDDALISERVQSDCGEISLREALSHTAGLGNNIFAEQFTVDCQVRGSFAYAGEGYVALESVFAAIANKGSAEHISQEIFDPLNMHASTMGQTDRTIETGCPDIVFALLTGRAGPSVYLAAAVILALVIGIASIAVRRLKPITPVKGIGAAITFLAMLVAALFTGAHVQVPVESQNRSNDIASTLKTSAPDLLKFTVELINPTLVTDISPLLDPQIAVNDRISWGLGVGIDRSNGATTYWHWGSNPGYQSLMVVDRANGRSIVVLTNSGGFLDFFLSERGGYYLARLIAREHLGIDGHWTISDPVKNPAPS